MKTEVAKPIISEYSDPVDYISEMIRYRKATDKSFSVSRATAGLRRTSPALVSLILKRKRKITIDRVDELSKLMSLSSSEKFYFKNWLENNEKPKFIEKVSHLNVNKRKEVGVHILSDWLNVYVKDCFNIKEIQVQPDLIYQRLLGIASQKRIKKSIEFLKKHGYLKTTVDGHIRPDTPLVTSDPNISNDKIKNFHKNALKIAKTNIDLFSKEERYANAMTIALTKEKRVEFLEIINEFTEKLKNFAEDSFESNASEAPDLHQFILNLSPIGRNKNEV